MQRRTLLAFASCASLSNAWSQSPQGAVAPDAYPRGPVKLVVPFPAGSSTDAMGREVAQVLARRLGQPVVVDNKPGALATIGAAEVARAKPDGYTLLLGTSTSHAAAPSLFKRLSYDPAQDFAPVGRVGAVNFALAVRNEHPAKSVQDLIVIGSRKDARPLSWGYANSANRVACAALVRHGNLETTAVPYKGVPQIMMDILGGQIDFTIADLTSIMPQVRSGKMRALAVTSPQAAPELPGVPPLGETIKGFSLLGWYGLFAPAGTPESVVQLLSDHLQRGLADREVQKRIESAGLMPYPGSAAELKNYVAAEIPKWSELIKAAKIDPE